MTDPKGLSTGTDAELGDYTEFGPTRPLVRRVWLRVVVMVVLAAMLVSSFVFRGWGVEATLFSVAFAAAALVFVAFDLAPASRRLQVGDKGFRLMPDGWFVPWEQVEAVSAVAANQITWVRVKFVPEGEDPRRNAKPERVRIWLPATTPNPMDLMALRLGESADREG